jgi:hypothetical protein
VRSSRWIVSVARAFGSFCGDLRSGRRGESSYGRTEGDHGSTGTDLAVNVSAIIVTRGERERLWSKVQKAGSDECWLFTGARNAMGYGIISIRGRSCLAHRLISETEDGPIPEDVCVLHHCDNPPCCNPAHLFRGDRADNNHDMITKGRHSPPPRNRLGGERNGQARLTNEIVEAIRTRRQTGESGAALAREFGVSPSLVSMIHHGRRWAT